MSRNYSSISEPKTLTSDVSSVATQITLNNVTGLPSVPYVLVLNPDTANEEVVLVTTDQTGVTSPTLKVSRAIETGASAKTHTTADIVKHMIVGTDLQIVHDHFSATTGIHGIAGALAPIASPTFTGTVVLPSTTSIGNVSSTELAYVDGVTSAIQTQLNTKAPLASPTFTGTVTLPTGAVTSTMILDGTILNADINASAAIDWTKLGISSTVSSTEIGYVDGVTSAIQTQLDTIVNTTIPNATPVGTIVMFGAATAPTGWLLCDGQSTASYAALAAVVGANVPDLMGRAPIGYGSGTGLTARSTIGAKVGAEEVTLTEAQMPSHSHTYQFGRDGALGTSNTYITQVSPTLVTVGASSGAGSGAAHPNMQPSTVVNFIIKY